MLKRKFALVTLIFTLLMMLSLSMMSVNAGDTIITNNSGTASTTWYISGEKSLVINGFDLQNFNITLPTRLDAIRISVRTPTPGVPLEAVVYQDANGGSPVDATLVGRKSVDITTAGVASVAFDQPLTISQRFLWVGFYMPVNFEFLADTSGSSVLTYWAWEPNSTFDIANLSTADVLGPANGTAPVNMNMGGIARITADLNTGTAPSVTPNGTTTPETIQQIVGDPTVSLAPMVSYNSCGRLYYDSEDITVTYKSGVSFACRSVERYLNSDEDPTGYRREGPLFDVYVFGLPSGTIALPYPVTHCFKAPAEFLPSAILGVSHGAPRQWELLRTVRFGEFICAELSHVGFVSFFVPK